MTRHELRRAMGEAYGSWYWRQPKLFGHKPGREGKLERVRFILEYRKRRAELAAGLGDDEINARGNIVIRDLEADLAMRFRGSDRYGYDCGPCKTWQQMDTWQDAPYFGVWFNDDTRQTFTYCEGDRVLVNCPSPESYARELGHAIEFYRRGKFGT